MKTSRTFEKWLRRKRREERADRQRLRKENMTRKEAEAATAADYEEYQQLLKDVRADCAKWVALNTQSSNSKSHTSRRPTRPLKNTTRRGSEAAADDEEYEQMLKDVRAKCAYWVALNTQGSSSRITAQNTKPHTNNPPTPPLKKKTSQRLEEGEHGPIRMEAKEETLLKECEELERQLKRLKRETKDLQQRNRRRVLALPPPVYGNGSKADRSSDRYRRRAGKRLTEEERRAVLHCFQTCDEEDRTRMVFTAGPLERTAYYLGIDVDTVQDVVGGIKH